MRKLNDALINTPVLRFFDPRKQVVIQADASKDGLGACLLREGHPAAYASRASTETEKNYAQIAKELSALVFSVRKFHQCVFGVRVDVRSDHKPLENILRKPLGTAPSRVLQRHDLNVIYTPGTEALSTETLERLTNKTQKDETLQLFLDPHNHGWPPHRKQLNFHLMTYWPLRHTVAFREGVMFEENRIILSAAMRKETLHQWTKALARKHFY